MSKYTVYTFDEFFESGLEESISPFLEKKSKKFSKNLSVKIALSSFFLLVIAYIIRFSHLDINIAYFILSLVYLFVGIPSLLDALEDVKNSQINISVLMTLAGFLAILLNSPFEGALLFVLFKISDSLEKNISYKTKSTIYNLNKIAPSKAFVVNEDGSISQKSLKDITVNTKLLIKAGEVITLDGKIVDGKSSINQVHLTGESLPVEKTIGDDVYAGSMNIDGSLTIEVTKISANSTISKIIKLISEAQKNKPKIQRWLDNFGKIYSTVVIVLALIFAIFIPLVFHISYFTKDGSLYRSIAFLIATSPCALIIGAPLAYLTSISACAKNGIILKGGFVLGALKKCKIIAFDKTGTLTTGDFIVTSFEQILFNDKAFNKEIAIAIADSLEKNSTHPIAKAIHAHAKDDKYEVQVTEFKSIAGQGIQGICKVEKTKYKTYIGKKEFIEKQLDNGQKEKLNIVLKKESKTNCCVLINKFLFVFTFADQIREDALNLINILKKKKSLVMLTGDNQNNANFVANKIGLEDVYANLSVEDKLSYVSKFAKNGLVMVGDGINDAPSLSRATIGVSLGKVGSATAIDASDVILLNDDIMSIEKIFKKSKSTSSIAKQNLIFSLLIILVASLPSLFGLIPLWLAVCLHEGSSLLVGLNCLRLLKN